MPDRLETQEPLALLVMLDRPVHLVTQELALHLVAQVEQLLTHGRVLLVRQELRVMQELRVTQELGRQLAALAETHLLTGLVNLALQERPEIQALPATLE